MKRHFKIITFLISAVFFLVPFRAFAQGFGWFSEGVAWLIRGIGYLSNVIVGLFLALAASLSDFALQLNITYLSGEYLRTEGSLVKVGWELSRDVANLGFVLAIIIIAFATIIQYKQYGAKKLLPKLIAAAIIINFSMAIVTPVIAFSNTITNFFLAGQLGANYGENIKLSQIIADSFGPQKLIMGRTGDEPPEPPGTGEEPGAFSGFGKAVTLAAASALFSIVFTTITAITFFALAFMLIVRYVILSFLLILAPIAWLVWVIPGLENLFSKWWSHFFKWSFFAPAMSLFIYLALVGGKMLEGGAEANTVKSSFGGNLQDIMSQGAEMIILAGLMIGGLMVAQNMGIYGAKGAIGIAKEAGNWGKKGAARMARRSALQMASLPARVKGAEKESKSLAERTRGYAQNRKNFAWRWATSLAARGLTNIESLGTERLAKEYEKVAAKNSDTKLLADLPRAVGGKKVATTKELAKRGILHKANVQQLVTKGSRGLFNRYGQGGKWGDVEKAAGMNVKVNEELQSYLKDKSKGIEELSKAINEFAGDLKKKDLASMPLGDIHSGEAKMGFKKDDLEEFSSIFDKGVAKANHALTPNIIPKLNSKQRDNFETNYWKGIKEIKTTNPAKGEIIENAFKKTMANHASSQEAPGPAGGGGAPAGGGGAPAGGGS